MLGALMMREESKLSASQARLERHLENWAEWMQHGGGVRGCPSKSAGFVGGGYNTSFEDMCENSDVQMARMVDAIIDGLPVIMQVAINHRYLAAVWRARVDLDEVLEQAKAQIAVGIHQRGFY